MQSTALEFDRISKSFFGTRVLKDVRFALDRGEVLGLVGENGAGKSTLMNILSGVLRADAGQIRLDGAAFRPPTLARRPRPASPWFIKS